MASLRTSEQTYTAVHTPHWKMDVEALQTVYVEAIRQSADKQVRRDSSLSHSSSGSRVPDRNAAAWCLNWESRLCDHLRMTEGERTLLLHQSPRQHGTPAADRDGGSIRQQPPTKRRKPEPAQSIRAEVDPPSAALGWLIQLQTIEQLESDLRTCT
ncbi:uncharacterized protein E0L32_002070 [Thyridium curvatum]|uniref:Uncharacterized protein n=1 Tax=Thyridium curvatum TaxID=1093900 RepID=A0A507ATC2_9PEZI|nr:uncharacterized protein E0L32_002063 [Thyridium curvatum]XP_030989178.1 uncharacterized protein E0L32_002070 [Thyridium curvatum]TPX07460.1 hypothetical protein E0L32_002063 [Thyridium curvatum]TPX07467.1 hypothetical protein E0L32_002070 [Thyridium curvatum]